MARLCAIAGPTASGKSALALALAEMLHCEIVSCDSLAVYRSLDIGTAKPTAAERARVPHHLLDVVSPDEEFTAARYVELADRALEDLASRGVPALVVGGSGLYLRALLEGLFPSPLPDPAIRAELKEEAARLGWPALHARLAVIDPAAAARIDPRDPIRIERALEVHRQTGEPLSVLQARHRAASPRHDALVFVIDPPGEILESRIAARVEAMLRGGPDTGSDAGLIGETRAALARFGPAIKPLGAVGYRETVAFLDGRLARADLPEAIRIATRRFAKRQRTWFRKQPGTRVADPAELLSPTTRGVIERFLARTPFSP
ncbi:MAG: tRNA (adenosine(37)-N6)-dimethylallyltransferase MiaA [Myxococcales bacterium]|nr:tRNA (adenosine(37)-N6)-dimethylallyltransferase MiaA [Myxococcales bacterium]